jgi:hypothetical protein
LGSGGSGYGNSLVGAPSASGFGSSQFDSASSYQGSADVSSGPPKKQYSGFGNTDYQPPPKAPSAADDLWGTLSSTLSYVSEKSGQALTVVAQKSSETVGSIQTGDLSNKLSAAGTTGLATAKDLGSKGWSVLSSFYESTVKNTSDMWGQSPTSGSGPQDGFEDPRPVSRTTSGERLASKADNGWGFDDPQPQPVLRTTSSERLAPKVDNGWGFDDNEQKIGNQSKPAPAPAVSSRPAASRAAPVKSKPAVDDFDGWGFSDEIPPPNETPAPAPVVQRKSSIPSDTPPLSSNGSQEKRNVAAPGKTIGSRTVIRKTPVAQAKPAAAPAPEPKKDIDPFDEDWGWN